MGTKLVGVQRVKEKTSKRFQVEEGYGQICIFKCLFCRTRHRETGWRWVQESPREKRVWCRVER